MRARFALIPVILFTVFLVLSMISCAREQSDVQSDRTTYHVGVTLLTESHPFYEELASAMKETAAKYDMKLSLQFAESGIDDQQMQIESFIIQGIDALVVSPVDSETIGRAIKRANEAGIPVFTVNMTSNDGTIVCHVASDNEQGGRLVGKYMAELLDGQGKLVVIDHPTVTSVRDRTRGFKDEISKHPDLKVVAMLPGEGMRDASATAMEIVLESNPDINGVFAINDDTALGALDALRQMKRNDIVIVGYDGDPEAREEILKAGQLKASAVQYPYRIGATAIEMVVEHLNGGKIPNLVPIDVGLIDKASLEGEAAGH